MFKFGFAQSLKWQILFPPPPRQVASVLLDHQSSLSSATKKGFTPLHLAAKYGNLKVSKLLLARGSDPDAEGKNGVTPLHVAAHYDHQNVALLLLDKVSE